MALGYDHFITLGFRSGCASFVGCGTDISGFNLRSICNRNRQAGCNATLLDGL